MLNLQTALDSYATKVEVTAGLATKSDTDHTHTHEAVTDWDTALSPFWSTLRSATGTIPDTGSMGWSTLWSGTVGGDAVTTGMLVNIDEGDPMLTIQAKRGTEYGQIVLTKSDIKLQTGQGKELSVNSLLTTVGNLGDTYAPLSHTHPTTEVTGLDTLLAGKAALEHTHVMSNVNGLYTALNGKADTEHTHETADVTGLDDALDGKASASHTHTIAGVQNLQTTLNGKANSSHTHSISNITNLQSSLDAKATVTSLNNLSATVTNLQNSLNSLTTTVNNINSKYMPKSGGTFTGAITVQGQVKGRSFRVG